MCLYFIYYSPSIFVVDEDGDITICWIGVSSASHANIFTATAAGESPLPLLLLIPLYHLPVTTFYYHPCSVATAVVIIIIDEMNIIFCFCRFDIRNFFLLLSLLIPL